MIGLRDELRAAALRAELARLHAAASDVAPQVDCARPHGIPIDRTLCPPDDRLTELRCAVSVWEPR